MLATVRTAKYTPPTSASTWQLLLGVGLALPWLVPIHTRPWTGFHADVTMAVVCALAAAVLVVRGAGAWPAPPIALGFMALAAIPFIQYRTAQIPYFADAWLALAYVLALATAILVGARIETSWPGRLVPVLLGSFGLAALVSLGLAMNQWLQLDQWAAYTLAIPAGARPVANVAQPNKLATLFLWGLVAAWWAQERRVVRPGLGVVIAMLLLLGVALTRSRMGTLGAFLCLLVGFLHSSSRRSRAGCLTGLGLAAWLVLCTLGIGSVNAALDIGNAAPLDERLRPGTRMLHWQLVLDAIWRRPLEGWGWQQVTVAQSALASQHPATSEIISYSHNLLLDLLLWNGIPLGALVAVALGIWFFRSWRGASHTSQVALMLALSVLLLHSMLELPHGYTVFLLPAGLMMGAVEGIRHPESASTRFGQVPRGVVALILVGLVIGLTITVRDYLRIEQAWTAERLRRARIGSLEMLPLPETRALDHLRAMLVNDRTEARAGMTAHEIAAMRVLTDRFPSYAGLVRLARAQALNGLPTESAATLDRLCRTHPEQLCTAAQQALGETR
jgi:hypothetical protein